MAALLHDVLDDTPVSYADLEAAFGPRVAGMVAQVSKLSAVNQMLRRDKRRGVLSADPAYWCADRASRPPAALARGSSGRAPPIPRLPPAMQSPRTAVLTPPSQPSPLPPPSPRRAGSPRGGG
jgi:hypothetical protein